MKFAKVVFWIAGIWGVLAISPLYFLLDAVGRQEPPAVTHPDFYYGFVTVTLMWQVAFFVIAMDPARYRALMIPPAIAKFGYAIMVAVLHLEGRVSGSRVMFAAVDFVLAILFVVAFARTKIATEDKQLRRG
jgi:hypothetical protein